MGQVRGALALASLEQYLGLFINFATIATLSRLLPPAEIGTAVVATGISTIVFSLREFATTEFLIQQTHVNEHDTRTAFTIFFLVSVVLAITLAASAQELANFYGSEELDTFLLISIVTMLVDAISNPVMSLLRRDMAFGRIAWIRSSGAFLAATVSITFAFLGFGFVSIAIGGLVGACLTAALAIAARPEAALFRPSLASWRAVFEFGRYRGAALAINRAYEALPQLILGRALTMHEVGIYNRANTVCGIPDRFLLSSVFTVAYPALAAALRDGQDIKAAYLMALSHITAVYWPALIVLAILAEPIVNIVLGPNWSETTVLVQLLALAAIFWFPATLTYPVLAALGANRDVFLSNLVGRSGAAVSLCSASLFGLTAMALSQFVNMPFQMFVALSFVKRHVHFRWLELVRALAPSLIVTVTSVAGPLILMAANDFEVDHRSIGLQIAIVMLAAAGWFAGLIIARHPMLAEVTRVRAAIAAAVAGLRGTPGNMTIRSP